MESLIYLLSSFCFTFATFVIGIVNPIHSILLLILVFFFGSILLLILNVEFFALIFLIVYVGAIAVLFLFMVMTLDIKVSNVSQKFQDFFSYKSFIVFFLLLHLFTFLNEDFIYLMPTYDNIIELNTYLNYAKVLKYDTHLEVIGKALFKEYILAFLLCGFILFIAMVGAIVVTVEDNQIKSVKQQDLINQAYRNSENSIFNFKFFQKKVKKFY
jgi:NADH:ubiquinone oxidoreductase subunit 6 (subunit J)